MPISTAQFVGRLVDAAPEIRLVLDDHLADSDEVLLHLFVARVRDVSIAALDAGDRELAGRVVGVLDEGLRFGDDWVVNAVAVSFVEDTEWWDPARREFVDSWPPALRDEASRQMRSRGSSGLSGD